MPREKLLVVCVDALCDIDIDVMRDMPNFGSIMKRGSVIRRVSPVYPSFTYPCHVSIMTGVYPKRHGVPHNEIVEPGVDQVPWYRYRSMVKSKYLLDHAKEAGFSTCALNWPLTAGVDIDFNMPMIVPLGYQGDDWGKFYDGYATGSMLDRYQWRYNWLQPTFDLSLDMHTMMLALDVIRDERQPDVMFVKLCDLDTVRHDRGVDTEFARRQLKRHDNELGAIMESVRRYGDFDNTNFVVLGDHGQSDVERVLNFNLVLRDHGFLEADKEGNLIDFDAYCHSVGMSAWIALKNPGDAAMREKVHRFLLDVKRDPAYAVDYVFTKREADEQFHLTGPFDFVIESASPVSFGYTRTGELYVASAPGDYKTAMGSHGGLPWREHQTAFFACGPSVKEGAAVEQANLVDEAPTMARMLGLAMPDADGRVIEEILK